MDFNELMTEMADIESKMPTEQIRILRALEFVYFCGGQLTGSEGDSKIFPRNLSSNEQATRDSALNCLFHYFNAPQVPVALPDSVVVVVPDKVFSDMEAERKDGDIKKALESNNKILEAIRRTETQEE